MKKTLLLTGAVLASLFATGCANIAFNNGSVGFAGVGPAIYTDASANAMIPQYAPKADYKVVKRDVKATAQLRSFFAAVNIGDASYETLKARALAQAPGATDLTDVKIDYKTKCIVGINDVTVTLTATAIKY